MERLPEDRFLKSNENTFVDLRKQYGLDKPGQMDQVIDTLQSWILKQNHFVRKDFSREYLERSIILGKGSIERAKKKIDKICTYRTLLPQYFATLNPKTDVCDGVEDLIDAVMPKLTEDHYRVYILRNIGQKFNQNQFLYYYRCIFMIAEYLNSFDYCNGIVAFFDYREVNLFELVKALGLVEMRHVMSIIMEGYGMRVKGIHFLTPSKAVDAVVSIFKQIVSPKVAERIYVHRSVDTVYEYIPKEILSEEFGGYERSIKKLHSELIDILSTKEFMDYMGKMNKACTDESLRPTNTFNEQYLGMPGSFRALSVD